MKKVIFATVFLLAFVLAGSVQAQDDAISKYFGKYVDDERFTVVYVSPKMFQLFKKMDFDLDDEEADAVVGMVDNLKSLRILTADENTRGFYEEATRTINTNGYEILMTVRQKGKDNVQFLVKDEGDLDVINELLLLVGSDESFVLMSFVGNINLNNVSNLAKAFEEDEDDNDNQ